MQLPDRTALGRAIEINQQVAAENYVVESAHGEISADNVAAEEGNTLANCRIQYQTLSRCVEIAIAEPEIFPAKRVFTINSFSRRRQCAFADIGGIDAKKFRRQPRLEQRDGQGIRLFAGGARNTQQP